MADLEVRERPELDVDRRAPTPTKKRRGAARFVGIVAAVIALVVLFAYAFEVTDVDLAEIQSDTRQTQLVRILRSLAHPEFLTYELIETNLDAQIMMPCPANGFTPPAPDTGGPYVVTEPTCLEPGGEISVSGFGLEPNARGDLFYVPPSGDVSIRLGRFLADADGTFVTTVDTRERAETEPQTIRAVTTIRVGSIFNPETVTKTDPVTGGQTTVASPRISATALDTWDKIIETVFLALIATTVGTLIAVPLSFFAARNLMKEISTTMTSLTLAILAAPVGAAMGLLLARGAQLAGEVLADNLVVVIVGLVVLPLVILRAFRWAIPPVDVEAPSRGQRIARALVLSVAGTAGILTLFLLAALMTRVGNALAPRLASFDFLALFVSSLGDILRLLIAAASALIAGGILMFVGSRAGTSLRAHLAPGVTKVVNLGLAAAAGAAVSVLLAQAIGWLYEISDPTKTIWIPAAIGALIGLLGGVVAYGKTSVGIGLSIYYIARTIFNAIRAIEPLVMVIVFVVWVGIGPFAGALALALHTTAALAKLYSEQVESISTGPIEAVKATGATRLQWIVYAVAPQIVPPYISFTMYRWDINVRMSTIIGFAGGGGIGFLLQQNINLLNYRAAAVQMIAIAIVVASMDYLSSRLRERFV